MTTTILDVSRWQGRIDWHTLVASGRCDGVIIKATDGQTQVDDRFAANFDGAASVDLLEGTYHFAQPDETPGDAAKEATHYVETVRAAAVKLPARSRPLLYALDIEKAREIHAGPLFVAWVRAFVETVERLTGLVCWIYTGGPFWDEHDGDISEADAAFFAARPLWLAAYVNDPAPFVARTPWRRVGATMHQWSGDVGPGGAKGIRYPGIPDNVTDTSRFAGSIEALRALIAQPAVLPEDADTWPGTPRSRSSQRLRALSDVPIEVPNAADFVRTLADTEPAPPPDTEPAA